MMISQIWNSHALNTHSHISSHIIILTITIYIIFNKISNTLTFTLRSNSATKFSADSRELADIALPFSSASVLHTFATMGRDIACNNIHMEWLETEQIV